MWLSAIALHELTSSGFTSAGFHALPMHHCDFLTLLAETWFVWRMPPLHPLLVNFTACLLPVSWLSDLMARVARRANLAAVGFHTLLYGALVTPVTVATGWWWMGEMDLPSPAMTVHKWLGLSVSGAVGALFLWRWQSSRRRAIPGWPYLAVMGLLIIALVIQGHVGAMMTFGGG